MKLYGVMVVQNEADIIQDTLNFLQRLNIYEAIFFYDMGSEDDTFAKARGYEGLLHAPQVLDALYTNRLRYDLLAQHRSFYQPGDWVAIIDADEFYAEDPIELIRYAERENASCIKTYQAEFVLTDHEVRKLGEEDPARPIHERKMLRHKTFELELCTANEAIEDMELMGYPFQLFKGLETGQDSVVYRDGPKGYRLAQVEQRNGRSWGRRPALTVSPRPAVRMSLAEATESLNLTAGPFVFYAEALTGRGRVLYRRYDGHYGLITPAGAGLGPG